MIQYRKLKQGGIMMEHYDESDFYDDDFYGEWNICGYCNGSGEGSYDGSTCPVCKGKGEVLEEL